MDQRSGRASQHSILKEEYRQYQFMCEALLRIGFQQEILFGQVEGQSRVGMVLGGLDGLGMERFFEKICLRKNEFGYVFVGWFFFGGCFQAMDSPPIVEPVSLRSQVTSALSLGGA